MLKKVEKELKVPVALEEFETVSAFMKKNLERNRVTRQLADETMLVFEALLNSMTMQGFGRETELTITCKNQLGDVRFQVGFSGKRYDPSYAGSDDFAPELRILEGYGEKISYRYYSSHNVIVISVRKSTIPSLIVSAVGILLAIAVYVPISMLLSPESQQALLQDYIFPIEELFANAMLMVGAPVTLFSLLKNLSDVYIVAEEYDHINRLRVKTVVTSIVSILLALGVSALLWYLLGDLIGSYTKYTAHEINWTFAGIVSSMVPSSILAPFEAVSPFPLIVVAMLITYAFRSVGKHFDAIKIAIDSLYELFSRMLHAVMAFLPVFCFLAFLDIMLDDGLGILGYVFVLVVIVIASTSVLLATYALRLRFHGKKVIPFVKKLIPLMKENFKIGSAIDAVPFNVRYCVKHYGMDRSRIKSSLRMLAQINLDGNCYIIMLVSMLYILVSGMQVSWINIFVIGILVLFLSFGAPNQPGSILIGTLIIINYLNSYDMLPMVIYLEFFFGGIQNGINVISDIVTVAGEESSD